MPYRDKPITKKYYSPAEVARQIRRSSRTVLDWTEEFKIPVRFKKNSLGEKIRQYPEASLLLFHRADHYLKTHRKLVKWAIHQKEVII